MMKKVIFICLLSLTSCLSRPDGNQEAPAPPLAAAATTPTKAPASVVPPAVTPAPAAPPAPATNGSNPTAAPTTNASEAPASTKPTVPNPPQPADDNKTTNKTNPPAEITTVVPTVAPAKNETEPAKKDITTVAPAPSHDDKKNETTTPKTEVSTKAAEPVKPVVVAGRGFDGPSFIGGIILTLGLLAVGFMGFKYYRNQTERNYHTL